MRTIFFFLALILHSGTVILAQVSISTDGSSPDNSSMLDVKSTVRGLLMPRMTQVQRNMLAGPAPWLLIFQTDNTPGVYFNAGTSANPAWVIAGTGSGWGLTGNSGTSVAANFLGTTDNAPLTFRVNNRLSGRIDHILFNTSLGYQSLFSNTTGDYNTAIGKDAMYTNSDGSYNMACGFEALYSNTTGICNTACGVNGLFSNTTGNDNTAIGYTALNSNTAGFYNTAGGKSALSFNTTGSYNTATGFQALFNNSTAGRNVAIGGNALLTQSYSNNNTPWYSDNVAVGYEALTSNQPTSATSAIRNTAIGNYSLHSNTIGFASTACGYEALYSNTTGNHNTAIGVNALYGNTGGVYNTSTGNESLQINSTGSYNTAGGYGSLYSNTTGSNNTASGTFSLYYLDTQSDNTAMGYSAGDYYKSDYGTFLGRSAYPNASGYSNVTALGYNSRSTASNQVRIGNASVTSIGGFAGWTDFSDERYKFAIRDNVKGLDFILRLRPVSYRVDVQKLAADLDEDRLRDADGKIITGPPSALDTRSRIEKSKIVHTGFLAQEVEAAARSTGFEFSGVDAPTNGNGLYGLRYAEFVVPLVKAVQEQQEEIENLRKTNSDLARKLELLQGRIEMLEISK